MKRYRLYLVTGRMAEGLPEKIPAAIRLAFALAFWRPCLWAFDATPEDERVRTARGLCRALPFFELAA